VSDNLNRMDDAIGLRPHRPVRTPLGDLVPLVEGRVAAGKAAVAATVVTGIALDSRLVRPGDIYAALPGARAHGADFGAAALAAGAVAVRPARRAGAEVAG
jgi:UDP-N-acetylmuramoyl-L-alanyl-D-glutamate--2,6-diaminopimelate ligase